MRCAWALPPIMHELPRIDTGANMTRTKVSRLPTKQNTPIGLLLSLILVSVTFSHAQTNPNLQTYFKDYIGLRDDQIATIRSGQTFAKTLHSRKADDIFVFGAVYINAAPESYLKFSRD